MIYLDYAASTPVDQDVLKNYIEVTNNYYANPNSNHTMGANAKKLITEATNNIAEMFNVKPDEIIYTSGATESNNLAIRGTAERYKNRGKHILVSSLEHNSIIAACTALQENGYDIELIPIDKNGLINIEILKQMIRSDTILVSVCAVDSELGIVQPIEEIGKFLKNYENIVFHTDASQSIGKVQIDFSNCDLITIAPHKFYGMNGISVLIKKQNVSLKPLILGGKSTTIYRSGTPQTALITSTSIAIKKAIHFEPERTQYITKLSNTIKNHFKDNKNININNTNKSLPHTINISVKGIKSDTFVEKLNNKGIMVSAKTSCCPLNTPSKLIYALTQDKTLATTSIRVSLSYLTTQEEVNEFLKIFDECYKELNNGKI